MATRSISRLAAHQYDHAPMAFTSGQDFSDQTNTVSSDDLKIFIRLYAQQLARQMFAQTDHHGAVPIQQAARPLGTMRNSA